MSYCFDGKARPKGRNLVPWALLLLSHLLERYHLAPILLRRIGRFRGVGCRDRFHEAADFLRRAPLHIVGDVRIGVQCEPCAEVAQHTGPVFHIHTVLQRQGRERMTQIINLTCLHPACSRMSSKLRRCKTASEPCTNAISWARST